MPPKALAKLTTLQVKPIIPDLIHYDPSGFLHGRNIAENFIYAADIINTSHNRKIPTMVFELDFKKAFDLVSWAALATIL